MATRKNMDKNTMPVRMAVVEEKIAGISDIKTDVKSILTTVQNFEVQLAKTPTWAQLKPLYDKVELLEMSHERSKGAKKVWVTVGSAISACSGVVGGLITKFFTHPATENMVRHTSEAAKDAANLLK
jgi:hypothetical protein